MRRFPAVAGNFHFHPAQANEPTEENISRALYERIDRSNIVDIDGVHVNFDNVAFFQFVE